MVKSARIYKYEFNIEVATRPDGQILSIPKDAPILEIGSQDGIPMLWCYVDPEEKETVNWTLRVFGTGWDIPVDSSVEFDYIGTLHLNGFVWHCFKQYPIES